MNNNSNFNNDNGADYPPLNQYNNQPYNNGPNGPNNSYGPYNNGPYNNGPNGPYGPYNDPYNRPYNNGPNYNQSSIGDHKKIKKLAIWQIILSLLAPVLWIVGIIVFVTGSLNYTTQSVISTYYPYGSSQSTAADIMSYIIPTIVVFVISIIPYIAWFVITIILICKVNNFSNVYGTGIFVCTIIGLFILLVSWISAGLIISRAKKAIRQPQDPYNQYNQY
ncbi:MAG: hypothetical protein HUJ42_02015 [Malacoplasma sp.]|nr:hypothetical protein [Malacoplasma sp.]